MHWKNINDSFDKYIFLNDDQVISGIGDKQPCFRYRYYSYENVNVFDQRRCIPGGKLLGQWVGMGGQLVICETITGGILLEDEVGDVLESVKDCTKDPQN